jgi:hypothetical protein
MKTQLKLLILSISFGLYANNTHKNSKRIPPQKNPVRSIHPVTYRQIPVRVNGRLIFIPFEKALSFEMFKEELAKKVNLRRPLNIAFESHHSYGGNRLFIVNGQAINRFNFEACRATLRAPINSTNEFRIL